MADEIYIKEVQTNIDRLSEKAIHKAFVDLVGNLASEGADFLKATVPHGETLGLATHAGHKGPVDDGINIIAEVGIPHIDKETLSGIQPGKAGAVPGEQDSGNYPIFVDRGTGIFGPTGNPIFARRGTFMKLPPDGKHSIFQQEVKGQHGQHFMAKTYAEMKAALRPEADKFKIRVSVENRADALS